MIAVRAPFSVNKDKKRSMRNPEIFLLPPNGEIPNHRHYPVVIYRHLLNKFRPYKAKQQAT